jgi:hypothetical protein
MTRLSNVRAQAPPTWRLGTTECSRTNCRRSWRLPVAIWSAFCSYVANQKCAGEISRYGFSTIFALKHAA